MARKIEVQIVGDASSLHRALGSVQTRTSKFGKVLGTSFRAGSVAATGGLVALGFAAKDLFDDFSDGQKATAQTRAVLKSTGGAANVTSKHVQNLATTIQGYSGIQDDAVQGGENMLLTFKNIRNEAGKGNKVFDQSTRILADMSQATGQDMTKSAIQLGKALNDPIKGITSLSRVGVQFTDGQRKSIKAMVDSGNTMGAQKVILKELRSEFGGSAKAAGQTFSGQMNILRGTFENAGDAIIKKLLPFITRFAQWAVPYAVKGVTLLAHGISHLVDWFSHLGGHAGITSDKIHSGFASVVGFFKNDVMPIVRRLKDIFEQSFQAIAKAVNQHGEQIHRIAERLGAVLKAIAKVAIPILRFALVVVLPKAIGFALDALDKITSVGEKVVHFFSKTLPNAFRNLKGFFSKLWGDVSRFTSNAWNNIINKVGGFINKLIGWADKIPGVHIGMIDLPGGGGGGGGAGGGRHNPGRPVGAKKGALIHAVPGGVYQVAEGGYDEAVLSTDPKYKRRTYALIGEVVRRLEGYPRAGSAASMTSVPQLAGGGIVHAGGGAFDAPGAPRPGGGFGFLGDFASWIYHKVLSYVADLPRRALGAAWSFLSGGPLDSIGHITAAAQEAVAKSRLHLPYLWGGGHGSHFASLGQAVDCSGGVSEMLGKAGALGHPLVSGDLMNWGKSGPGMMTVFANPTHTYMQFGGKYTFGTSNFNPGGGWGGPLPYGARPGFAVRHYNSGGRVPGYGPQLAVVHGGETVLPTHRPGGGVIQVNVVLDRKVIGRALADIDKDYRRQNGGRPLLSGA